jgi:hypothetical protein
MYEETRRFIMTEKNDRYPLLFSEDSNTSAFEQVCDVFIAWTMRCAEKKYEAGSKLLNRNAKRMLSFLVSRGTDAFRFDNKNIREVKIYRQETISGKIIDIRVTAIINEKEYQIVIENKFDDVMQEEQLRAYKDAVDQKYPHVKTIYIAINSGSTDDAEGEQLCKKAGFKFFYLCEISDACFKENDKFVETNNPLFDEFWIRWPEEEKKKNVSKV